MPLTNEVGHFYFGRISKGEGDIILDSRSIYILRRTQALMPNTQMNTFVALKTL